MKIENLEKAQDLLVDAYLELEESIEEENDDVVDPTVDVVNGQKGSIQNAIAILNVTIAKLKKQSTE